MVRRGLEVEARAGDELREHLTLLQHFDGLCDAGSRRKRRG
jgi:hypothetical protein